MQDLSTYWHQFISWLSALFAQLSANPEDIPGRVMSSLWEFSLWLNNGYRGLTIALLLLVIIVNRILNRQH